jgi:hypothetical protein
MQSLQRFGALTGLAFAGALAFSTATFADETTTTTTHHEDPAPGVEVGIPGVAGVHIGGGEGCSSKTVTHTDEDTGESVSHTRSNC